MLNKKNIFIIFIFLITFISYSQEKVVIGVSSPFMKNQDVNTIFINKQFVFELLSNFNSEKYSLEINTTEYSTDEENYIRSCKNEAKKNKYDYQLFTTVYSLNENLFVKIILINPYDDLIIYSKYFKNKIDLNVNEVLQETTLEISSFFDNNIIVKVKNKDKKNSESDERENISIQKKEYMHEVFIMNGFLKSNPLSVSFFNWFIGYNITPFSFFSIETSFFWGCGEYDKSFNISKNVFKDFYLGGYNAVYLFIANTISPTFGLRLEFTYLFGQELAFGLPIDIGIKIFMTPENVLRINSSFQFVHLNCNNLTWERSTTIGISIGYARKI